MCGFVGYVDLRSERMVSRELLVRMNNKLIHRGPDSAGFFVEGSVGLAFRRLSIVDLATGDQPIFNEDRRLVLLCAGEIYNAPELRNELEECGHAFSTRSDVEVLIHLYEECGAELLRRINGQFAFVIYDRQARTLFLARDHFGVMPLYYGIADGYFLFASEIKAILEHPSIRREVDLTGLDQVLSFPGLVSPRTVFKGIESLKSGHWIYIHDSDIKINEYWDLDYPLVGEVGTEESESYYVERLSEVLERSVAYRLQADVPIGLYLSGGLDSSIVAAIACHLQRTALHSFSISFSEHSIDESRYQRLMAQELGTNHHEITFNCYEIEALLRDMVYHSECPVKEAYNTCALALSAAARREGIKVVLAGEGADELFAGYPGYVFDQLGRRRFGASNLDALNEERLRARLWGDPNLFYEVDLHSLGVTKTALYSEAIKEDFGNFDCTKFPIVSYQRLRGRDPVHQRSYLDFKLRLSDHLLSDHGDRMTLANSVEGRFPFLDLGVVELACEIPPHLKIKKLVEKYILRRFAVRILPREIAEREKFGFRAPGVPYLLRRKIAWIDDLLSYDYNKRQGYFDPDQIEILRRRALTQRSSFDPHLEVDLLMVIITFNLLCQLFELPPIG